jgi:uncharacterized protein (DUF2336 family)
MALLTADDVERLLREPSAEVRADTVAKIATSFDSDLMDGRARTIAKDIFRYLLRDVEVRVRSALSENLKDSQILPHDIALSLANDVIEVAEPVLKASQVLTDEDLVEIVQNQSSESRVAIAQRDNVAADVCEALVETADEKSVATMVGNDGAEVSEETFEKVLDVFPDSDQVKEQAVSRTKLPVKLAERLVTMVSDELQSRLISHHELSPAVAANVILQSREKATLALLTPQSGTVDVENLVEQLHSNGRLTPTIILRGLCTGDRLFFEAAMARLANISAPNAHILIFDAGPLGLRELYRKSGLDQEMFEAIRAAVSVVCEMEYDGEDDDRERFRSRMIERFLTQFEGLDVANLDYLMARIGNMASTQADAAE